MIFLFPSVIWQSMKTFFVVTNGECMAIWWVGSNGIHNILKWQQETVQICQYFQMPINVKYGNIIPFASDGLGITMDLIQWGFHRCLLLRKWNTTYGGYEDSVIVFLLPIAWGWNHYVKEGRAKKSTGKRIQDHAESFWTCWIHLNMLVMA